ncbi:hypothetical protein ACHMW5_11095 [Azospirillum melinis]
MMTKVRPMAISPTIVHCRNTLKMLSAVRKCGDSRAETMISTTRPVTATF